MQHAPLYIAFGIFHIIVYVGLAWLGIKGFVNFVRSTNDYFTKKDRP